MPIKIVAEFLNCEPNKIQGIGQFCTFQEMGLCGGLEERGIGPCQTGVNVLRQMAGELPFGTKSRIQSFTLENGGSSISELKLVENQPSFVVKPPEYVTLSRGTIKKSASFPKQTS